MRRAQNLRDILEDEIVTGRFRPTERLDEQSLAARFGVSRTPVREAIMQLASTGLVDLQPRRGAFVAALSFKDVCGALAARRITEAEQRALDKAHEDCAREASQEDPDAYYYANERFHLTIYEACRNAFLVEQARQLHTRLKPYRRLQLRARSRVATSLAEHRLIVDAIRAGDSEAADRVLREHILIQGDRLADFIASFDRPA